MSEDGDFHNLAGDGELSTDVDFFRRGASEAGTMNSFPGCGAGVAR
ncbi:hypothetical protein HGA13_17290 [Nocardia speluncae]|uniref:Uncharacterized protein n=1 Tax=Nocardia speluncae TaxID=419477 RepID=A0A846XM61_9NOCA|nr:hypothetical protein [Nocardia speluncae]NKY34814.1 hypothetical protein [Nocardia speluncae]